MTTKQLRKKAWKLISIYVRSKNTNWRGYANCFTCLKTDLWKNLQCGHYIHNKLDFDERNLKPQCQRCNHFLRGNLGAYAERLIGLYGRKWMEKLRKDAQKKGNLYSRKELIEIIERYA